MDRSMERGGFLLNISAKYRREQSIGAGRASTAWARVPVGDSAAARRYDAAAAAFPDAVVAAAPEPAAVEAVEVSVRAPVAPARRRRRVGWCPRRRRGVLHEGLLTRSLLTRSLVSFDVEAAADSSPWNISTSRPRRRRDSCARIAAAAPSRLSRARNAAARRLARAATPRARNLQTSVQVAAPEPEPTPTTKPIFFAFGNGNVEPVAGGVLWGGYLETKNVKARAGTHKRRDASSLRAAWSGGRS